MDSQAIRYLESNLLLHIPLLDPLQRGQVEILSASGEGVLLREKLSGTYLISAEDPEYGVSLLKLIPPDSLLMACQEHFVHSAAEILGLNTVHACYQAVYLSKEKAVYEPHLLIRKPSAEELAIIQQTYKMLSEDELAKLNDRGELYGGFEGEHFAGFIGRHREGSIGLLEVFPEYRRHGCGMELESFMVNKTLEEGRIPFCHVMLDNDKSLNLQKKIGFTIADTPIFWIF